MLSNVTTSKGVGASYKAPLCKDGPGGGLAEALAEAVEKYKERLLKGLNALTEEEIEQRIAEFKALYMPEDPTPEELEAFSKKLALFRQKLDEIADGQEMLIVFDEEASREARNNITDLMKSQINTAKYNTIMKGAQ